MCGPSQTCLYPSVTIVPQTARLIGCSSVNMASDADIGGENYFFDFEAVWTHHNFGENLEPHYKSKHTSFSRVYNVCTQKQCIRTTVVKHQSDNRSELAMQRNCPKTIKICTFPGISFYEGIWMFSTNRKQEIKFLPSSANLPVKVLLIVTHIGNSSTKLNFDFLMAGSYKFLHFPMRFFTKNKI